jgi:hypothetical protein
MFYNLYKAWSLLYCAGYLATQVCQRMRTWKKPLCSETQVMAADLRLATLNLHTAISWEVTRHLSVNTVISHLSLLYILHECPVYDEEWQAFHFFGMLCDVPGDKPSSTTTDPLELTHYAWPYLFLHSKTSWHNIPFLPILNMPCLTFPSTNPVPSFHLRLRCVVKSFFASSPIYSGPLTR